jgi:hypothetical protein
MTATNSLYVTVPVPVQGVRTSVFHRQTKFHSKQDPSYCYRPSPPLGSFHQSHPHCEHHTLGPVSLLRQRMRALKAVTQTEPVPQSTRYLA